MFFERLERVRAEMRISGIDVLLLSTGPDLPYFSGYEGMPLERLTLLVVPVDDDAKLLIPALEASRVIERPEVFHLIPWSDGEDPIDKASQIIGSVETVAIDDQMWSGFLIDFLSTLPKARFLRASEATIPIRSIKDSSEIEALRAAGKAVDRVVADIQRGDVSLVGRTEFEVANQIGQRILEEGHRKINFVIVASGPNAASPHHEPGNRVIKANEGVLFDFGGTMDDAHGVGYCSDITRCVYTGEPSDEFLTLYNILFDAQKAGVNAAIVGTSCEEVDTVTRSVISEAGFGDYFIHRTGHGIGVEAHEHPNIVVGNTQPLVSGHAFSIEPGIYLPGHLGMRLEDIVVCTETGPDRMNQADRSLVIVGS